MFLSQKEAAAVLGVDVKTVQRLIERGRLRATDLPGPRLLKSAQEQAEEGKRPARIAGQRKQIALDDLHALEVYHYVVDEGQVALIKARRERGNPDEAIRHLRLSEDRLLVMEQRLAVLEGDRLARMEQADSDLATENAQLRATVEDLRTQLRALTQRINEGALNNAPVRAYGANLTGQTSETVQSTPVPFVPRVPQPAHPLDTSVSADRPPAWTRSAPASSSRRRDRSTGYSSNPELPEGWESVNKFGDDNNIPGSDIRRWRFYGLFTTHEGRWRPRHGHKPVLFALDPEQQQQVLQLAAMPYDERLLLYRTIRGEQGQHEEG
jgi:excisionase family DNA binding protein